MGGTHVEVAGSTRACCEIRASGNEVRELEQPVLAVLYSPNWAFAEECSVSIVHFHNHSSLHALLTRIDTGNDTSVDDSRMAIHVRFEPFFPTPMPMPMPTSERLGEQPTYVLCGASGLGKSYLAALVGTSTTITTTGNDACTVLETDSTREDHLLPNPHLSYCCGWQQACFPRDIHASLDAHPRSCVCLIPLT